MKKMLIFFLSFFAFVANIFTQESRQEFIDISSQRELFIDRYLIDTMINTRLELHHPIDEGPVIYFDKPWEGQFSAYCTVLKDGDLYRLYYRGIPEAGNDGNNNEVIPI